MTSRIVYDYSEYSSMDSMLDRNEITRTNCIFSFHVSYLDTKRDLSSLFHQADFHLIFFLFEC